MFKVYFLIQPGEDPYRYQGDDAAAAVRRHFPESCGYVQTRALPGQENPSFSGTAELWFDRAEQALAAVQKDFSPMMTAAAQAQSALVGMERVVMRTPGYLIDKRMKGVYPFCRKAGMTLDEFQSYWWHTHGPIAALTEEALAYVQIHPLPESYDIAPPFFDGITEITWRDADAAMRGITSRQMKEDQAGDASNFVENDSVALYLAEEEIVIAP